jgi:uncharacterized protein
MSVRARVARRVVSEDAIGVAFGVLALAFVVARQIDLGSVPAVETFVLVLVSIVVEALPFILLGAVVSAGLAAFVPESVFVRVARLPRVVQLPCAAFGAFAFPVCDCGTVPVARRLLLRGLDPAASLTFMLAAPIVNPLVLVSTWVAYGGGTHGVEVAAARAIVGLITAIAVGLTIGRHTALRATGPGEDEHHDHSSALDSFGAHLTHDFLSMGRFIVIGAALAALLQTVVPQSSLAGLAATPVIAELALMAIAFALSLCSEADAFVAASLGSFGIGPQLAFLVFGPIGDAKLTILYSATFRRLFALRLLAVAVPIVIIGSLLAGRLLG